MNIDLNKLEEHSVFSILLTSFTLVCPGVLVIYVYNPELLDELNVVKLILLACSIVLPILVINMIMLSAIMEPNNKQDTIASFAVLSSFLSLVPLYLALILSYFFVWSLGVCTIIFVCLQVLVWIGINETEKDNTKEKQR